VQTYLWALPALILGMAMTLFMAGKAWTKEES